MTLKIALPKGRLLAETAALLSQAGWGFGEYREKSRLYRLRSEIMPGLFAKVFHERDIPIQVAIGNYDMGICGLDWVEELLAKYPSSAVKKLRDLDYGAGVLHLVASRANGAPSSMDEMASLAGGLRIASEYPNLAESLALNLRLRQFSIFPLWGGAEVYPPESADLALIPGREGQRLFDYDLASLGEVQRYSAFLIANKDRGRSEGVKELLASVEAALVSGDWRLAAAEVAEPIILKSYRAGDGAGDTVRLALPDGHQQQPTLDLLKRVGIEITDYPSPQGNRRPLINLDGVTVKVIRPQDMPLQVASGNFDLAITGRDWLREHLYQFPSSPVIELTDLSFGRVRIVAVVSQDMAVSDIYGLRQLVGKGAKSLRVASEYVNIADKYARDNHLGGYRIVPTWGATEAFLPEDADLLIENTQTGRTIAKHNLKIIDTLGQSSACLIGSAQGEASPAKRARMDSLINSLRAAVEGA